MILTQCACCAAPLPHLAKQCSRCKTRYCGPACQKQHWEGGGHDLLCKKIKKGGGAEQYNADKKFVAAVATAAEECAEATKGQTCYICTEAVHRRTKEGLVRGCACRGTAGFAHVSCLVEQVKILCDEAEANNLDFKDFKPRWDRWSSCSLCEQSYHGVVKCALGWACWKTYLGRNSEQDFTIRLAAMTELGNGLFSAQAAAEALVVHKAQVVAYARNPPSSDQIDLPYLGALSNVANCFAQLGREEEAQVIRRMVLAKERSFYGDGHLEPIMTAANIANAMVQCKKPSAKKYAEIREFTREWVSIAQSSGLGDHHITNRIKEAHAYGIYRDPAASLDDVREGVTILEDVDRSYRQILGKDHPVSAHTRASLIYVKGRLAHARVIAEIKLRRKL